MDKINKALKKLSVKERKVVSDILAQLLDGDFSRLDLKKLKGYEDIFRVRKSTIRIIFKLDKGGIRLISIDRRKEDTYKF